MQPKLQLLYDFWWIKTDIAPRHARIKTRHTTTRGVQKVSGMNMKEIAEKDKTRA